MEKKKMNTNMTGHRTKFGYRSVALLPTKTNVNLHITNLGDDMVPVDTASQNLLFADMDTQYVLRDMNGKYSVAQTSGMTMATDFDEYLGEKMTAHHDQAGYTFGDLEIVGIRCLGVTKGFVPNRKLTLRVFK